MNRSGRVSQAAALAQCVDVNAGKAHWLIHPAMIKILLLACLLVLISAWAAAAEKSRAGGVKPKASVDSRLNVAPDPLKFNDRLRYRDKLQYRDKLSPQHIERVQSGDRLKPEHIERIRRERALQKFRRGVPPAPRQ